MAKSPQKGIEERNKLGNGQRTSKRTSCQENVVDCSKPIKRQV